MSELRPIGPIPTTYVYRAQVQSAMRHVQAAMAAMGDVKPDGATAARELAEARRAIDNVEELLAEGITS